MGQKYETKAAKMGANPPHNILESFQCDAIESKQEYPVSRQISGIIAVLVDGKPVNYEVIIRLKRRVRANGKLSVLCFAKKRK